MQNCSDTASASDWFNNAGLLWLARKAHRTGLQLFMVGGSVRDHILGIHSADIDLVCAQDPTQLARAFAHTFKGHWFSLDTTRKYSRVILSKPHAYQFDFSPLRAPDLNGDLALRDFTINAMAIDLADLVEDETQSTASPQKDVRIIDPLHGQDDLICKRLHLCSETVLDDDPLRILKGLRHCATLGFCFSPATISACSAASPGLAQIAPERIRSEIAGIFSATHLDNLYYALNKFHTCGAAAVFNLSHPPSEIKQRTRQTLEHAFIMLDKCNQNNPYLASRMQWSAGDEFCYRSLGLLATWIRSATVSGNFKDIGHRLKLSRKGAVWLQWFLTCPIDIFAQLEDLNWQRNPRRALQHLTHAGAPLPHGISALVFFCRQSTEIHALSQLWQFAGNCFDKGHIRPLIRPAQIQQAYPQIQGENLGRCLHQLNSAERHGVIQSISEAWEWLEEYALKLNINPDNSPRED